MPEADLYVNKPSQTELLLLIGERPVGLGESIVVLITPPRSDNIDIGRIAKEADERESPGTIICVRGRGGDADYGIDMAAQGGHPEILPVIPASGGGHISLYSNLG